jgi:hypothetical protein
MSIKQNPTIAELTEQALELHRRVELALQHMVEAAQTALELAMQAGAIWCLIKHRVTHGFWEDWVAENVPELDIRTVQKYMDLARNREKLLPKIAKDPYLSIVAAVRYLHPKKVKPDTSAAELLRVLKAVSPGLAKSAQPDPWWTGGVIFNDGLVYTIHEEIACQHPVPWNFFAVVPHKPLLAILDRLTEEQIEVEATDAEMVITAKDQRVRIPLMDVRGDPALVSLVELVELVEQVDWTPLPEDFCDALSTVRKCCAIKDNSEFQWLCVHITANWMEACNGFHLCRWRMKTGIRTACLIKYGPTEAITASGMTEFAETDCYLHFRNKSGLVLSCRRSVEDYPKLGPIFKGEGAPITLPAKLRKAIDKTQVFAKHNTENSGCVTIELSPQAMTVSGHGWSGSFEQSLKLKEYQGKPIAFEICWEHLAKVASLGSDYEIQLCEDKLLANNGKFSYAARLFKPDEHDGSEADDSENDDSDLIKGGTAARPGHPELHDQPPC